MSLLQSEGYCLFFSASTCSNLTRLYILQIAMHGCSFCLEPSLLRCMARSLYHKHSEDDQRAAPLTALLASPSLALLEALLDADTREFMPAYLPAREAQEEFQQLAEYYKFRIYVPLFAKSRSSDSVLSYYYSKLKHYYNSIKRKLHITVEPSSSSSQLTSLSQSNISTREELLRDIKCEIELDRKRKLLPALTNFQSESKALEELLSYMKLNNRFDKVKTLKTEDCFQEQHIFEQTINKKLYFNHPQRIHLKAKISKKLAEPSGRKTPLQGETNRERPPSRSRSIKFIKGKEGQQTERDPRLSTPFKIREEDILRESQGRLSSIGKRHSSLTKLTQNHYTSPMSPYKRKSLSKEKGKAASTATITLKGRQIPIEPLKDKGKIKESLVKIQGVKFQNELLKTKTTPNSPAAQKAVRQGEGVLRSDNILSIRKKKLEMLKEKVSRR